MADPTLGDAMNSLAQNAQQSQGDMGTYGMGQIPMQAPPGMFQQPQARGPQGSQGQAPPMPLPWGQPDEIELAQLQQGLRSVQRDSAQGIISGPTAQQATQKIHGQLQPLLGRQQQAQTQAAQKAEQAAMKDAAMQEGIYNVHQTTRAKNFQQVVGTFVDPVTGKPFHAVPTKDGSWDLVKPKDWEMPAEEGAMGDTGTIGAKVAVGEKDQAPIVEPGQQGQGEQQPQTLEQIAARASGQQPAAPVSTPRVLNAAGEDITARQDRQFGQTLATPRDELGRPTGPPPGEPGSGTEQAGQHLSQQGLQELFRRADSAVPRLPPGANEHLQLHRQELVSQLVSKMVDNHHGHLRAQERAQLAAQEHRQQESATTAEHKRKQEAESVESQRKEQARSEESQRKEQEKQEGADKESLAHRSQELRHITGDVHDEAMKYREKIPKAQWPAWMKDEDSIDDEINGRYQKHLKRLGVNGGKPKQRSGPDAEAQKIAGMLTGGGEDGKVKDLGKGEAAAGPPRAGKKADPAFLPGVTDKGGSVPLGETGSTVGGGQVKEVLGFVDRGLAEIPAEARQGNKLSPEGVLHSQLTGLRGILKKAADAGRGLSKDELSAYRHEHGLLERALKPHGFDASHLRLEGQ